MSNSSPLPRSTPEQQGISSTAIQAFLSSLEPDIQYMHSFMLLRHGHVVAEGWWQPYQAESPHMLFSLSKSFTSSAIGIAIHEGLLTLDDHVLNYFKDEAPGKISPNLAAMQVRHLLSMSTGHTKDTTEHLPFSVNPMQAFLEQPVDQPPGTLFVYNSGATLMLSAIIQKITGQKLVEYLTPRLFEPLGILDPTWDSHPQTGVNFGGWGLNIKTEDIARFGQLYLQKGQWQGRQIIPAEWVETATAKHISNGTDPTSDWTQGYGYQFWRCAPAGVYRGDGAFGQYCVIMPEQDMVVAITSGQKNDMQDVLTRVWQHLLPALQNKPLPAAPESVAELSRQLSALQLPPVPESGYSSPAEKFSGTTFQLDQNPENIKTFNLDFQKNRLTYELTGNSGDSQKFQLDFGRGDWANNVLQMSGVGAYKISCSGGWTNSNTFELIQWHTLSPFMTSMVFLFADEGVSVVFKNFISFAGPSESPACLAKPA